MKTRRRARCPETLLGPRTTGQLEAEGDGAGEALYTQEVHHLHYLHHPAGAGLSSTVVEAVPQQGHSAGKSSIIVPINNQERNSSECSNYRGITLISHTMKVHERLVNSRLGKTK
ncbi:unnamed protein product [Heligmosomoides polygyrus]|uniref:Uncharacterized protein n=1 Tax=Heligmosomoides polygyrus TaxID=6339 RepID=A0A183F8T8_HELPZ|nr:unnamed protein product [Heligmosomoides polygyrus]